MTGPLRGVRVVRQSAAGGLELRNERTIGGLGLLD
jgi:hypothetical protein